MLARLVVNKDAPTDSAEVTQAMAINYFSESFSNYETGSSLSSGTNVILTWPTNALGFTLQSTTNLVSPPVWSTNSPAPIVIGGQNVIINPKSGPKQFFRLISN